MTPLKLKPETIKLKFSHYTCTVKFKIVYFIQKSGNQAILSILLKKLNQIFELFCLSKQKF